MLVQETYVNETKNYQFGESDPYEPFTEDIGRLFRALQREYGRCISRMYYGNGHPIGWVFQKRMEYEDWRPSDRGERYYIREVWVTLLDESDTVSHEYHYHHLDN